MGSFGAPRTAFGGAPLRGPKGPFDAEKTKDGDPRDRFGFRPRNIDNDAGDRFRDGRNANFKRRDGETETEGWSTVKPRKSFGQEGAERFNGRMGGERPRDDKRHHRDDPEKTSLGNRRAFDGFMARDKENVEDCDERHRNGVRNKSDSWFKPEAPTDGLTARERIDKAKSWRERNSRDVEASDDRSSGRAHDGGRTHDRRWGRDRDHRVEREPEWMDEPADNQAGGHTEEDFKRFMEQMKARESGSKPPPATQPMQSPSADSQPKAPSAPPPTTDSGPDKFFMAFAPPPGFTGTAPGAVAEPDVLASKPKPAGKSSRFTSFFNATQEERRMKETQMSPMEQPPAQPPMPLNGAPIEPQGSAPPEEEKMAFQQLLMKLQKQTMQNSPSPVASQSFQGPPAASSAGPEPAVKAAAAADTMSPEPPHQYRGGSLGGNEHLGDDPRKKMPWAMQDIIAPQPMLPQQTAAARQDQLLQNLVGHRAGSGQRMDPNQRHDSNTEFLMNLMRSQPEAPHTEQVMLRMPQPQKSAPIPHVQEREPDFAQNTRFPPQPQQQQRQSQQLQQPQHLPQQPPPQHQHQHQPQPQGQPPMQQQRQMRPQPPPFMDDPAFHHGDPERLPQQPQVLQRPPPPPGLDQMGPGGPGPNWMPSGPGGPGPQQRILPPPGLPGGLNRNIPVPNIYPPNFPPQGPGPGPGFPSPDGMAMPPRNMQPPPGIYGAPPPGFFPPPGGFQGPPPDVPFGAFDRMPPGVPRGFPRP